MGRVGIYKVDLAPYSKGDSSLDRLGINSSPYRMLTVVCFLLFFTVLSFSGCSTIQQTGDHPAPVPPASKKISGGFTGCLTGAFVNGTDYIAGFEDATGRKLAVVMWYVNFTQDFPAVDCGNVSARDAVPLITWEPWKGDVPDSAYSLQNIIDGVFDTYITEWAQDAKLFSKPFFLRFAHEMNGNWYPWDGANNGSAEGPEKFISAWKHVHDLFAAAGADNVTWVWNVNAASVPDEPWNSIDKYYPGDAYVDWIGVDGYNWGLSAWQSFDSIFSSVYADIRSRYPAKPLMLGEFACAPDGGDKAAWITDAFSKIRNDYAGIKIYNWFNITKERDWQITSNEAYSAAFKSAVSDTAYFIDTAVIP